MLIHFKLAGLRETRISEVAARFAFGGLMTVVAGLIASRFGPSIGGLFLAFPAIFPAGATLVEKHERRRKQEAGFSGSQRGIDAAGADAAGAALGAIGLAVFAVVLAWELPDGRPLVWLPAALAGWAVVNGVCWFAWKRRARIMRKIAG
jgi:hypothetical protein